MATKKIKDKLRPSAQWLILELQTINRLQNEVWHANNFLLRSLKLKLLEIENEEDLK